MDAVIIDSLKVAVSRDKIINFSHNVSIKTRDQELERIRDGAALADAAGLECHAGHGLSFDTVGAIAVIRQIQELNIGHFLVGEAIFSGLDSAIKRMRALMDKARAEPSGRKSA